MDSTDPQKECRKGRVAKKRNPISDGEIAQGRMAVYRADPAWLSEHLMSANKRIPVTEARWEDLHELKEAGQTWDELLGELAQEHRRRQLADRVRDIEAADEEELTSLDEL